MLRASIVLTVNPPKFVAVYGLEIQRKSSMVSIHFGRRHRCYELLGSSRSYGVRFGCFAHKALSKSISDGSESGFVTPAGNELCTSESGSDIIQDP